MTNIFMNWNVFPAMQSAPRLPIDGHFCLLNGEGIITRIPVDTFSALAPNSIVLLTEDPIIISKRRQERDNISCSVASIKVFQEEEIKYAKQKGKEIIYLENN